MRIRRSRATSRCRMPQRQSTQPGQRRNAAGPSATNCMELEYVGVMAAKFQMRVMERQCHLWCSLHARGSDIRDIQRCAMTPCFHLHNKYMRNNEPLIPQPESKPHQPLGDTCCKFHKCLCCSRQPARQRKKIGMRGPALNRAGDGDDDGATTVGVTKDSFSMNAPPSRMALDLAVQVAWVCCSVVKDQPSGECKWWRVVVTLGKCIQCSFLGALAAEVPPKPSPATPLEPPCPSLLLEAPPTRPPSPRLVVVASGTNDLIADMPLNSFLGAIHRWLVPQVGGESTT